VLFVGEGFCLFCHGGSCQLLSIRVTTAFARAANIEAWFIKY
jgi:hypothetical protein